ncbi:AAA family ATPase [Labrys okinawensis]|uniref:AAA family ATPase n=1 Tax=Labrys okinawensis TaxID=346911 RepID=UPI0039BC375E
MRKIAVPAGAEGLVIAERYQPLATSPGFKSAAAFCAEYQPLSYAIEPIVRSASLYTITARTGAGKTAFQIVAALAIATGRQDILGVEVSRGRVAYLAFENPDDARMRFKIAAYLLNIDLAELADDLVILDARLKPEEVLAKLDAMAMQRPFSLILVDTLAAWFDGDNINDNVQGGEFMRRIRPLTRISGLPSVLVAAHPVKNASEENLVPYGGGAILNEVDGNLCLAKQADTGLVTLHWQGKLRGLEFKPIYFRFEITGSPEVIDAKGRQVQLPTLRPSAEEFAEERHDAEINIKVALLKAMLEEPTGTQTTWGAAIGRTKSNVNRKLQAMAKEKLVEVTLGKWSITPKGKTAVPGA